MASYTPNINLKKPTTSEYYNVLDENSNKDKIDTAIGTLNSKLGQVAFKKGSLPSNATATFTIPNGGRNIIFFVDSTSTRQAAYIVSASAAGAVFYKAIATGTDLTISTDTNTFTVTKPANSTPMYMIINLQGDMPTVS